jgi:DNA repair exonuclease SbcCD ATPase subunit
VERSAGPPSVPPEDDAARPATVEDVRSLRRWLAVAAVWALAATAIAVIALLEAGNEESGPDETELARQVSSTKRELGRRIESLQSRIEDLPRATDLSKLEGRLREVEDRSSDSARDLRRLTERVDDLERDVRELGERRTQTTPETGTTPGDSP